MSIDSKCFLDNHAKAVNSFCQMFAKLNHAGIKQCVSKLQQTMSLADTLFFLKMRWPFYGEQPPLYFVCATSCILQKMPNKQLKVILPVIDDEKNVQIFSHLLCDL